MTMKMLFVHNFHRGFGGDDTVTRNYMEILRRRGHTVLLYSRHNDEVAKFRITTRISFPLDVVFSMRTWREVGKLIRQEKPDLVFVHNIYPLLSPSVYYVAWRYRVPIVQMVHDMRFWCTMAWFFRQGRVCTLCSKGNFLHAIRHRCYRGSIVLNTLYALSIKFSRIWGCFEKIRLFVIPSVHIKSYLADNGVSEDRIALHPHIIPGPGRAERQTNVAERYVAFLGRLSAEKGVWLVMRAAEMLPHVKFKIAGMGSLENELRGHATAHNLHNVEFSGFLSGNDKEAFLQASAFLVAPSQCYESFGQIVLEAFAAGIPVIAADHGGLASSVKNGVTGWLFPPGSPDRFVELVREAWDSPMLNAMGRNALTYFETNFGEESLITNLERSLENIVSK